MKRSASQRLWPRSTSLATRIATAAVTAIAVATSASAQFGQPAPTAFENAQVIIGDGTIIENATLIVQGGTIAAVAPTGDFEVPERTRKIDLSGMTITPGFIDAYGAIGNTGSAGSRADHRAIDAFDPYAIDTIKDTLARGVTTIYLPARGSRGLTGLGSVIRLTDNPGDSFGSALVEESALCINLGSSDNVVQRLNTFNDVRKSFKSAKAYRESLEAYEADLEEYEEKLTERVKKEKADEEKKESGNGKADEESKNGNGKNGNGNGKDKKEEEIKKPQEPRRNAAAEIILKAIDGELQVRITAWNNEDIYNALEFADEYNLKIILESAGESRLLAAGIAEADIPVVLDYASNRTTDQRETNRRLNDNIASLDDHNITWVLGSGATGIGGRFLWQNAQLAMQSQPDDSNRSAIQLITQDAAKLLNIDNQTGTLARGRAADMVIWSGDPSEPGSHVQQVYVDGRVAWDREKDLKRKVVK